MIAILNNTRVILEIVEELLPQNETKFNGKRLGYLVASQVTPSVN